MMASSADCRSGLGPELEPEPALGMDPALALEPGPVLELAPEPVLALPAASWSETD